MNLGVRYERYHSFYPDQSSQAGQFSAGGDFPARDILTWNRVVPRLGAAWDLRGNGKSVLKGTYGWYSNSMGNLYAQLYNPNGEVTTNYRWHDLNGNFKYHRVSFDSFPVSPGHALVVPKRHVMTLFEMSVEEYADCFRLILSLKDLLLARYSPDGYNVGANCGEAAGQSVWHAHIHVIPRYTGDVPEPRGGVRGVIPLKASY